LTQKGPISPAGVTGAYDPMKQVGGEHGGPRGPHWAVASGGWLYTVSKSAIVGAIFLFCLININKIK